MIDVFLHMFATAGVLVTGRRHDACAVLLEAFTAAKVCQHSPCGSRRVPIVRDGQAQTGRFVTRSKRRSAANVDL